jgi:Family of unknown function (DUF6318)
VRFRFLAIGLIAGLLAACSGGGADPKPSPSPSAAGHTSTAPSSPASPTRTGPLTTGPNVRPGEKPPVYPDLAKQHTANGALAFAAYYFRAFDWSYATNNATLLRGLSLETCAGCKQSINAVAQLSSQKEVLRGGRITLRSARILHRKFDFPADYIVDVTLDEQPVVISGPSAVNSTAATELTSHHSLVFLRWASGTWKVADVTAK